MENLKQKIKELSKQFHGDIVAARRHLHANPELSFEEHNTVAFIEKTLHDAGISDQKRIAKTGLVVLIKGKNPSKKTVALRADIDALPILEENNVDYKSQNDGVMHACGHDVHTSSLIGVAKILHALKDEFEGTVKLLFQPAEEKLPGGALGMIKDGALKNPAPTVILGQHVWTSIDAGVVGFCEGTLSASGDELRFTVKGKGGHGAVPNETVDPVVIAAHIILALQQIVSRNCSPLQPSVLSIGKVEANGITNIIPNEVHMQGTFRAMDETWRNTAHEKITQIATKVAEAMGGSCEVHIGKGYPSVINEEALTRRLKEYSVDYMGEKNIIDVPPTMGAEDFSYYTHEMPGCFYLLGIRNEAENITSQVHTPTFNIDESALEHSIGLMSWLALNELVHND